MSDLLPLKVLNPKKKGKKKKYINSGTVSTPAFTVSLVGLVNPLSLLSVVKVTLLSFKVESEYTFVDFIRGGYVVVSPLLVCKSEENPDIRRGEERSLL